MLSLPGPYEGGKQHRPLKHWRGLTQGGLTAVGDGEAVGHLQVVDVRREAELGGAKLKHPDPKGAVLLVCSPGEEAA